MATTTRQTNAKPARNPRRALSLKQATTPAKKERRKTLVPQQEARRIRLPELPLRYVSPAALTPARADRLVDLLVGYDAEVTTPDEKIAALVELVAGLEDKTGSNLFIGYLSLRVQRTAYNYSRASHNDFADFVVENCGGSYEPMGSDAVNTAMQKIKVIAKAIQAESSDVSTN